MTFIYLFFINNNLSTENKAKYEFILQTSTVCVITAWNN